MRRRNLMGSIGKVDPSEAVALDVAFYDGSDIVIRKQEDWKDGETPIGIVVVPGTHDRYGDGSCGIMSLVEMDLNHPESGKPVTSSTQIDGYGQNIQFRNNDGRNWTSTLLFNSSSIPFSFMPYQQYSSPYQRLAPTDYTYGIWPYDGSVNGNVFTPTSDAVTTYTNTGTYPYVSANSGNPWCDFNGLRNTITDVVYSRSDTNWTANTIDGTKIGMIAFKCCGRFKTIGTKSTYQEYGGLTVNNSSYGTPTSTKDNKKIWYMPSAGELTYMFIINHDINVVTDALIQKYGNVASHVSSMGYMSSSCSISSYSIVSFTYSGVGCLSYGNWSSGIFRAFMRL